MSKNVKTDNKAIGPKLEIRRYFLTRYHAKGRPQVFDACQGTGVLWKRLRTEYDVRYWGVDQKPQHGRLKIDSRRILAQPGWSFDVVDIDTYGSPWSHWIEVLRHATRPVTVFLTVGTTMQGGSVDGAALDALGLGPLAGKLPTSFRRKLSALALDYSLSMCYLHMLQVVECCRTGAGNAQYIGVRLKPGEAR